MGAIGRERVEQELSWGTSRRRLLEFYHQVLPVGRHEEIGAES
jgi:hypothetical protein